jgi:hypothetical protein
MGYDRTGGGLQIYTANALPLALYTNGVARLTIASTGAATFSNDVTQSRGLTGFNQFSLRNTTAGTGSGSIINMGNDTSVQAGALWCFSSTYSTSPGYAANGITLAASYAGGLSLLAEHASGTVRIYAANTLAATFTGANSAFSGNATAADFVLA